MRARLGILTRLGIITRLGTIAVMTAGLAMLTGCMSRESLTAKLSPQDLKGESDSNLCKSAYSLNQTSPDVLTELVHRDLVHVRYGRAMIEQKLETGMTWCEATIAWGPPDSTEKTAENDHTVEVYHWTYVTPSNRYIHRTATFRDGRLSRVFAGNGGTHLTIHLSAVPGGNDTEGDGQ